MSGGGVSDRPAMILRQTQEEHLVAAKLANGRVSLRTAVARNVRDDKLRERLVSRRRELQRVGSAVFDLPGEHHHLIFELPDP
eukprot:3804172-Lingulodinium_polyedra.AAC.1